MGQKSKNSGIVKDREKARGGGWEGGAGDRRVATSWLNPKQLSGVELLQKLSVEAP